MWILFSNWRVETWKSSRGLVLKVRCCVCWYSCWPRPGTMPLGFHAETDERETRSKDTYGWGGEAALCCPEEDRRHGQPRLKIGWACLSVNILSPSHRVSHRHSHRRLCPWEEGKNFFADRILIFGPRRNRAKDYLKALLAPARVSTKLQTVPRQTSAWKQQPWREGFGRLLCLYWKGCQHFGKAIATMSSSGNSSSSGTAGNPTFKAVGISLAVGSG